MKKSSQPWTVVYEIYGGKKPITRRFSSERKARAFYRSLWNRRLPPMNQSIHEPSEK